MLSALLMAGLWWTDIAHVQRHESPTLESGALKLIGKNSFAYFLENLFTYYRFSRKIQINFLHFYIRSRSGTFRSV